MSADNRTPERYLPEVPLVDVMMEQLRYLVEHASGDCPADCVDCARLGQVKAWLLLPFHATPRRSWFRAAGRDGF